jgi:hypothetical protein
LPRIAGTGNRKGRKKMSHESEIGPYVPTQEDKARLEKTFTYHAPKADQVPRYNEIRDTAGRLAKLLLFVCPPTRERSLALTSLEEAVMWANAAIARNE